jgi:hypothetical protein
MLYASKLGSMSEVQSCMPAHKVATQPGSLVVIAGDLNAKVGTAMPLSTKAAGAILQHNAACGTRKHQHISFERKQRHPDSDFSGKLLHDMCQATHLQHPLSAPTLASTETF